MPSHKTIKYLLTTTLAHLLFLHYLITTAAADDNILLNCGSSGDSTALDTRTWIGDTGSKFLSRNGTPSSTTASQALTQASSVTQIPFSTARLSASAFTYSFPLTPGQKFLRLYFYPAPYSPTFSRRNALFTVKTDRFTLLQNFNASLHADSSNSATIFKEYSINIFHQILNLTFTPNSSVPNSYAFINGIEIVSMPTNLYYKESILIRQDGAPYSMSDYTALETSYRINIGGAAISPVNDTEMFRTWSLETEYLTLFKEDATPYNNSISLKYTPSVPNYTAPKDVYTTARTMGRNGTLNKSFNLTWSFPVDVGFSYLVRMHFCEFQVEIVRMGQRVFNIYLANQSAVKAFDVFRSAGGREIPYFSDYLVLLLNRGSEEKRVNLSVELQPYPDSTITEYYDAILNGIEIFKLNDTTGNLAGVNPDPLPATTKHPRTESNKSRTKFPVVIGSVVGGVGFLAVVGFLLLGFFIFRRRVGSSKKHKGSSTDGTTTLWGPFSYSTTKSTKTRGSSSLPSDLCRYFSLAEIKAATNDFDGVLIVGVGGFGDVYKGYVNMDGKTVRVAIKRLKPGSEQGAHEFKTEIEMLSQLRHLHLVPLIGYCNEGEEMILVYDYMACGTLRDHLYGKDNPSLPWIQRLEICIGAARGLHYLHTGAKHRIIHRDMKTTNILLDEKWVAKVSDFGLSKVGPTDTSKTHVSTVVKGSFGYLDPEYYRRQRLTEKSDVYSFGVVLCEVLCARPPVIRTKDKEQAILPAWVQRCYARNALDQMVDLTMKDQVSPACLRKFVETAVSCVNDNGTERPSMNDVVWGLEFALQLQQSTTAVGNYGTKGGTHINEEEEKKEAVIVSREINDSCEEMFSSSSDTGVGSNSKSSGALTAISSNSDSKNKEDSGKGMSGSIFSEIMNSGGR